MSEKHIIVQGAICKCQYGTAPDKLKVTTHNKEYANDADGVKKLIASNKDIGAATFEKNMFGSCSKMNNNPCKATVQEWQGFYDKITLTHGGQVLTEDSKAICPVGGNPCIEITWHGQTAAPASGQVKKTDENILNQLNPAIDKPALLAALNENQWEAQ